MVHGPWCAGRGAVSRLHIAVYIVEAERVRGITPYPDRPAFGVAVVGPGGANRISKMKRRRRSRPRRVFPFRLARQAVGMARLAAQPRNVFLRIIPAHIDDRAMRAAE